MSVRFADRRRVYVSEHPAILSIALVATITGAAFLLLPDALARSSIGQMLPAAGGQLWAVAYCIGGLLILCGFHLLNARFEMLGLMLLSGCFFAFVYAIIAWRGIVGGGLAASVIAGPAIGCALRAATLRYEPEFKPWRARSKS